MHAQAQQYDPTRTTTLRNTFARKMRKRFRNLRGVIRQAIIEQDCFGMQSDIITQQMAGPGYKAFNFPRSADKVEGFIAWLQQQQQRGILEITGRTQVGAAADAAWTNQYITDSYKRGVHRARYELRAAGYDVPELESTGGVQASLEAPVHADRLGLLWTRAFNELRGITEAMDQQISRVLAQGIADGDHPRLLARKINAVINGMRGAELGLTDTLGRWIPAERRAIILARTEIIRAHAEATLNEFDTWRMEGVRLQAEWMTAGDRRVCPRCETAALDGPYTIEQARGMIPLHPQCRCTWLPLKKKGV
jgi:SPP1 gp7 family putative phage head morphogenesis protein